MLLSMRPLAFISLPGGKQVRAIPMRHIRVTLPQVAVTIGEAVGSKTMPEASAVLAGIVAVVSALLHPQALSHPLVPLPLVVVPIVVLADAEAMPLASLEVAVVGGTLGKGLAAQAMVETSRPLQQPKLNAKGERRHKQQEKRLSWTLKR